ncbi:tRNA N6-adenosine threonylcarbamoyltransferase [Poriferisphaera corsica]|uniref:tRNA N6-adenosine threonylcarbamoyltransferase n=1 Tax=Poriferisphaera corsica TaxID=2528020 RepID=A0A517YVW0_9BACT|nr:tRNA (adenosine(37)-N6)-threonylcarbamoyltransferase complex transferase subunit TsaD [Poriferisphaera corsica]QDU34367.1 tRNA N6-adenosine threonylcarbamoyltransferase [Poriferisphaera corsica]
MTLILGIESSCDETAASIVKDGRVVLSNIVASQHELHERYRGVVPEIASRAHLENILPVIQQSLHDANLTLNDINAIAVGNRPGLIGSLIVGVSAAKALAWSSNKPLIDIDHVQAHLYAASLVESNDQLTSQPEPQFPALGLVVSGGHTTLYQMNSPLEIQPIGRTIDDAIGEAYDKAAVILKLGYPGGPLIDKIAAQGDPTAYDLPRSMLKPGSLDFSFSGLKTALLYAVRGKPVGKGKNAIFKRDVEDLSNQQIVDLAASFQAAAIDAVIRKLKRAVNAIRSQTPELAPKSLVIGGGVSANSHLRERVKDFAKRYQLHLDIPAFAFTQDNAAMIAGLAHIHYHNNSFADLSLPAIATSKNL